MAIEFPCPHCSQLVTTADSAAGKKGRCPHCHEVVQIPAAALPTRSATPPTPRGKTGAAAGTAWKGAPTQPPAAQPRPATQTFQPKPARQAVAEDLPTLTPLDSVPGLLPLGPGADPLAGDPLAGLPPAQISGRSLRPTNIAPAPSHGPLNPLGTPTDGGTWYGGDTSVDDRGRKGLPWEREPSFDSFQDTALMILGEPQVAFRHLRRQGGLFNSLAYLIIGLMLGQMAMTVYYLLLQLILLMSHSAPAEAFAALGVAAAVLLIGCLVAAIVGAVFGSFLAAGVWHVILLVFGCTRGGFEATYRAVAFTGGSIALLNVVPVVGPLIGLVLGPVIQIHAFIHTHEAPAGRVTWAVLTPYALLCCCTVPLVIVSLGGLLSGLARGL